jgi:hypothetical protein
MSIESSSETARFPEMDQLASVAESMWHSAAAGPADLFPNFIVTHDGQRADFTLEGGPALHDRMSVLKSEEGVWCIEEQTQRPTLEDAGYGKIERITHAHTLVPGQPSMKLTIRGHLVEDGSLTDVECDDVKFTSPLNAAGCQRLVAGFRTIRGEDEPSLPARSPRRGWFKKLGFGR